MAKEKTLVVPLRSDIPIGTRFKFVGGRNIYEIVETKTPICCDACALSGKNRKIECASVFCTAYYRKDDKYIYVKKVK